MRWFVYRVDRAVFGDRHDHIARFGLARRRVQAITRLADVDSVFIVNIQIPGDPPVSAVMYFAVPRDALAAKGKEKVAALYRRFQDVGGGGGAPVKAASKDVEEEAEEARTVNITKKSWAS